MSKVTSKLQVTIPKALAERYGIRPGADIEWVAAGDAIRVVPAGKNKRVVDTAERLRRFDLATARQRERNKAWQGTPAQDRGWTRDDLYRRGSAR